MRTLKVLTVALTALVAVVPHTGAQGVPWLSERSLPISLFERYLESLRQQAGIPGFSAAIVQNGQRVWETGLGFQDVENLVRATPDTVYPVLDLSQTLASTVLLQQCLELRTLELTDKVRRWNPQFSEDGTTVAQLLSHAAADGGFRYDTSRYAQLHTVIDQCASQRYGPLLAREILDRFGLTDSVPGHDLGDSSSEQRRLFSVSALERYSAVLRRVAPPYKVDSNRRASRSDYSRPSLSASTGVVSTVRDLARFDANLDILMASSTRERAWQSGSLPTGLGWFVQRYNGERVIWSFGLARDAYSALYIKVPGRSLTLILFANSDGLVAPYNLSDGNVTTSHFAQTFLQLFVS